MAPRYPLDTDLDTIPIGELKKLAKLALIAQERDRVKARNYYRNNRDKCLEKNRRDAAKRREALAPPAPDEHSASA